MISVFNHSYLFFKALILLLVAGQFSPRNAEDTTLYFDIVHKDKIVGSLKTTKTIDRSKVYYQSLTRIETRIIKDIEVDYTYKVAFEKGILEEASVAISLNDKPYANTYTERQATQYQIVKNGKIETTLKDTIGYTTILLYSKEPKDISYCFSEQDGSFNTIVALGNHSYKKVNSKGRENTYHYKDGVLEKASIDGGLIQFELIARD